jgi:PAS domain S-box-containing protein
VSILVSKMKDNLFLIVFREKEGPPSEASSESTEAACVDEPAARQLEIELSVTRQELQTNIEQLKSLNEEMQSSNEELQAANEELETSREELQSLNEELITVNSQLQCKVEEQEESNNDLNNFFSSTNIPTIFLDRSFRVKRYTTAITKLIKLIPSDIGRQIIDMSQEFLGPDLIADARSVLENLVPVRKEINIDDTWYVRAALPYRTLDDRIEGVVITYNDVTELKRAEEHSAHLASFPQLNPNPVIEVDLSGKVIFSNPATRRFLESLKMDPPNADIFLPEDFDDIVVNWDGDNESSQYRELSIESRYFAETVFLSPQFNVARIYVFDITERKKAGEEIVRAKEEWERTFDTVPDLIAILDCNHTVLRVNKAMADRLGLPPEKCIGVKCYDAVHGTAESPAFCPHALTCLDSCEHVAEVHEPRLGGDFIVSTTPIFDEQGRLTGAVHVARDITERKKTEEEIRRQMEALRAANEELERFNRAAVGRELRMIELKKEVNENNIKLGKPPRYKLDSIDEQP